MLRCPATKLPVRYATTQLLEAVLRKLQTAHAETSGELSNDHNNGKLKSKAKRGEFETFQAALVSDDGCFLYPILDGIPKLLADEAINLSEFGLSEIAIANRRQHKRMQQNGEQYDG